MSSRPSKSTNSLPNDTPSHNTPENRRSRRQQKKKDKRSAEATPIASGPPSPKNKLHSDDTVEQPSSRMENTAFGRGEDFVPFVFSDSDEPTDETRSNGREKGKGKARDNFPAEEKEEKEKSKVDESSRKPSNSEREWDRGKEYDRSNDRNGSASKRKYGMVFDFDDSYTNKKQKVDASSRKAPWVQGMDWDSCKNVAEMLNREVEAFVNWISPTTVEDEVRGLVVSIISNAVHRAFPDAQVLPFGSFETKLYLPLGDIDLVILSNSMAYSDKVTVLHALANTIKRAGITSHVTIIAKAKVPIVKFVTSHGRFNVDISINQANGVVAGNIVKGFLRDMHGSGPEGKGSMALRSLVLITKAFLSQRSMNEVFTGGLGSYSIVCLAVSFLQMHPKIRRGEIDAEKNLGVLMMEFFELYGCYFNYDEVGISLREGGTYFSKRQRGWYDYGKKGMLSIEDPADPSNDISKGSYGFPKVRTTFAGAHGILTATAYLRAGMISSRQQGRSIHLRSEYQPEDLSILSSVMGITQETINHRKLVQEVYGKRTLHNILGVQPKPVVVDGADSVPDKKGGSSSSPNPHDARSVQSAWEQTHESDEEHQDRRPSRHDDVGEDEGGRYDIGQQPPKKRRRTGKQSDAHTVFIVDDDDSEHIDRNGVEEGQYASDDSDSDSPKRLSGDSGSKNTEADKRRRSYWLSKGIGYGGESDDMEEFE